MQWLAEQLQPFFQWLLRTSVQASVLIGLILLLQLSLSRRLGVRWHNSLWLLLLISMVMPWKPQSPASLFNLMPRSLRRAEGIYVQPELVRESPKSRMPMMQTTAHAESKPAPSAPVAERTTEPVTAAPTMPKGEISPPKSAPIQIGKLLPLIWLGGALILGAYVFASNFKLWKIVRGQRPSTDRNTLDLLEDCKAQMGIRTILGLVVTDKVKSPALFGFVRPRLLLPKRMIEALNQEELRYVFLHELAHLKRFDISLGWLMSLLQVLHWFNPLVWLAFYRMRADRELACDALMLARTEGGEPKAYGRTIVSLIERFSRPQRLPGMAGILETKSQLKRRLTMIARFKKKSYRWSPLSLVLTIIVGCVCLCNAKGGKSPDVSAVKPSPGPTLRLVRKKGGMCYSVSPDGKYLCDMDWDTDSLVAYDLATGSERTLVERRSDGIVEPNNSAISADSKTVAYVWWNSNERRYELHLVGLDGTGRRMLHGFHNSAQFRPDAWAPDGKRILGTMSEKSEGTQLVWVSVDDGSLHRIKELNDWPERVGLSPDGRHIAYDLPQAEDNREKRDIFVLGVDEAVQIPLIQHLANDKLLAWTPDGKNLFFVSDRMGSWDGWLQRVDDGKPRGTPTLVRPELGEVSPIGFTPTGSYLYAIQRAMFDVFTARLDPVTGKVVAPPEPLRQEGKDDWPDWSPDGKYLAYRSHLPRWRAAIHIRSLETRQDRVLDGEVPLLGYLRWSPDGKSVLAGGQMTVGDVIYLIDVDSSSRRVLLRTEKERSGPSELSPDGKTLFYPLSRKRLIARELETGVEREVFRVQRPLAMLWSHALSPDGKQLAVVVSERGVGSILQLVAAAGGEQREMFRAQEGEHLDGVTWVPDGKNLLFRKNQKLWRISVEEGEPQELWEYKGSVYAVRVHPDGQRIVFGKRDDTREVWLMENFLPKDASAPEPVPTVTLRRVTDEAGEMACVSRDGKHLCDVDWETGDLVVFDTATGKKRPLTGKGSWEQSADFALYSAISPDGKQVAYDWYNSHDKSYELHVIGLDGTRDRVLCSSPESGRFVPVEWSPDGKQIIGRFNRKDIGLGLGSVSVADGSLRSLKSFAKNCPMWIDLSPDGRYIAYHLRQEEGSPKRDIFLFSIEEKREIRLVQHPADDRLLGWTPDGEYIFFTSDRMGTSDGWLLRVADGKPQGIPRLARPNMGEVLAVGFARSGSYYYAVLHQARDVYIADLDQTTGEVLSSPRPLRHAGEDGCPDWSPDGKYLAYLAGWREIRIRSMETGQERVLDAKAPLFRCLRWSPDGKSILVSGLRGPDAGLVYEINVETAERTVVLRSEKGAVRDVELSADGKALFYHRQDRDSRSSSLLVRDLETGSEKQLLRAVYPPTGLSRWAVSPDGTRLALGIETAGAGLALKAMPATGGEPKELTRFPEDALGYVLTWTPDGRHVLFTKAGDKHELWRIPAEGGKPQKLWTPEDFPTHLRVHPDGRRVAFCMWRDTHEVWAMENFLPAVEASAAAK